MLRDAGHQGAEDGYSSNPRKQLYDSTAQAKYDSEFNSARAIKKSLEHKSEPMSPEAGAALFQIPLMVIGAILFLIVRPFLYVKKHALLSEIVLMCMGIYAISKIITYPVIDNLFNHYHELHSLRFDETNMALLNIFITIFTLYLIYRKQDYKSDTFWPSFWGWLIFGIKLVLAFINSYLVFLFLSRIFSSTYYGSNFGGWYYDSFIRLIQDYYYNFEEKTGVPASRAREIAVFAFVFGLLILLIVMSFKKKKAVADNVE